MLSCEASCRLRRAAPSVACGWPCSGQGHDDGGIVLARLRMPVCVAGKEERRAEGEGNEINDATENHRGNILLLFIIRWMNIS